MNQCPKCHNPCRDKAKFCSACGYEFIGVNKAYVNQKGQVVQGSQYNAAGNIIIITGDLVHGDKVDGNKIINTFQRILTPQTPFEIHTRRIMLQRVHIKWVEEFLKGSLYKEVLLEVGKRYVTGVVPQPWEIVVQQPRHLDQTIPPGTTIVDLFNRFSGSLLILGSPGSGKTTLLFELTQALITQAQQDETFPIPVVFNLSTWAEKRLPLSQWLIQELKLRYNVQKKVAEAWITHDQALPLLDGLDEVRTDARDACVEAINTFRDEHGLVGMVVCCRSQEYYALPQQIRLQGSVELQPLSDQHIENYLKQIGDNAATVRSVLHQLRTNAQQHHDAQAEALTRTPLLLSIATLAYCSDIKSELFPRDASPTDQQRHLFATYVASMFSRRGLRQEYTPDQTKHWLVWLAGRMQQYDQPDFLIEQINKDWLSDDRQRRIYGTIIGCITGVYVGGLSGLSYGIFWGSHGGVLVAIVIGIMLGLALGVDSWRHGTIKTVETITWQMALVQDSRKTLILISTFIVVIAILMGILTGTTIGLVQGVFMTIIIIIGLILPLIVIMGLTGRTLSETTYPNERIWRSLSTFIKIAIGFVIGFSLVTGVISIVLGMLLSDWMHAFQVGLPWVVQAAKFGVFMGLLFGGLFFGGLPCLQHITLRMMLYYQRSVPWNYARFLDYATERVFLRKIGGGYIFVHRLLLEYFASLEQE